MSDNNKKLKLGKSIIIPDKKRREERKEFQKETSFDDRYLRTKKELDDLRFNQRFNRTNSDLMSNYVRDSLKKYSDNFSIKEFKNPIDFNLNGINYSLVMRDLCGSGNGRPNEHESRIQNSYNVINQQKDKIKQGYRVGFIGISEDKFTCWDPMHSINSNAKMRSLYSRFWQLDEVERKGIGLYLAESKVLNRNHFAICLPMSHLGFYLENMHIFHKEEYQYEEYENQFIKLCKEFTEKIESPSKYKNNDDNLNVFPERTDNLNNNKSREKVYFNRYAYPRDPEWTKKVNNAYEKKCSICGIQLGLNIAAHIIPHSEPDCPNEVSNGMVLCVQHHQLYDDGLLLPGPNGKIYFNEAREEFLRINGEIDGLDRVKALQYQKWEYPKNCEKEDFPKDEYLIKGLELRGLKNI